MKRFAASLLFFCTSVLLWTGCSMYDSCTPRSYSCPPVCETSCPGPCNNTCPAPCAPATRCRYPSHGTLCCADGITVRAKNPGMCLLGDQYALEFEVEACDDVCDVIVHTELPEGVIFERSDPEAEVTGRHVEWNFGKMMKGECRLGKIWVECQCEGDLCACFCATATPMRFCSLLCACPVLMCEKCGPEEVCPGDPIHYTITVTNTGSCNAEDVVITDHLPDEVEHVSGMRTLCYKLGCLKPCESKCIGIAVCARERGVACNKATVSACNASPVSCEWCTCICCCDVEIEKIGPKEFQIGNNADYQITVTNTGDKTLTDLVITDCAHRATTIVAADGAEICGNQAVWHLRELGVGEKKSFNLTLTTCTPGCFINRVFVDSCQGCQACDDFTTRWRGRPALNVCIVDTDDPICIGDQTSYRISVVNQGTEPDDNVRIVVRFPPELTPFDARGNGVATISGDTVTFGPIDNFRPKQTLCFRIDARANSSGDARVMVEVSSDAFQTPIIEQESTIVH